MYHQISFHFLKIIFQLLDYILIIYLQDLDFLVVQDIIFENKHKQILFGLFFSFLLNFLPFQYIKYLLNTDFDDLMILSRSSIVRRLKTGAI